MDTTILEDIGLTNAEIKVYVALLELGTTTAGPVIEKTGLQNSVVHMTLKKLVEKGFLTFVKKGKVKHYQTTDPSNILNFIDEKKRRFQNILPQLLLRQKKQEKQEAEIYLGFKGFKNMCYEMIKDGKKGDEFLFFGFYTSHLDDFKNVFNFYKEFEKERKRKGYIVKGIAHPDLKEKIKGRDIKNILLVDIPTLFNLSVFRDKVIFTPWEEKPVSIMIHSKQLAEMFRKYFYSIWNRYKK